MKNLLCFACVILASCLLPSCVTTDAGAYDDDYEALDAAMDEQATLEQSLSTAEGCNL
jgi:hypothetical protein